MISALVNHLLQSTIFTVIAGALTLLLRNNSARIRYGIWLAASMKFLVPFALFVEIGHRLSWPAAPVIAYSRLASAMGEISQPFVTVSLYAGATAGAAPVPSAIPTVLIAIWICGSLAILVSWFIRWRRAASVLRTATRLQEGREIEALHRLGAKIELRSGSSLTEPGVFGIFHPVLSLPSGMADHLDSIQLDAIIAHEVSRVRRRDNLTAALHMLVEAVFWFHPLVWWLGARLVAERERACDEEVIRLGSDPEAYAEGILKVCRFYLASPIPCVAGISGSDLARRVEIIMSNATLTRLTTGRKLLLGTAALLAFTLPLAFGILTPAIRAQSVPSSPPTAPLEFEAAAIKPSPPAGAGSSYGCHGGPGSKDPGRMVCTNMSPVWLVTIAYDLNAGQLSAPDSAGKTLYDITATIPAGVTKEQYHRMIRTLLIDRFKLRVHFDTKVAPVYELTLGKNGPKVKRSVSDPSAPPFEGAPPETSMGADGYPSVPPGMTMLVISHDRARYQVSGDPIAKVANMLSPYLDRPVIDKTGLQGNYDFSMYWVPYPAGTIPPPDAPGPTITEAIEDQLGFRLVPAKDPVDILVVDHLENAPTEN